MAALTGLSRNQPDRAQIITGILLMVSVISLGWVTGRSFAHYPRVAAHGEHGPSSSGILWIDHLLSEDGKLSDDCSLSEDRRVTETGGLSTEGKLPDEIREPPDGVESRNDSMKVQSKYKIGQSVSITVAAANLRQSPILQSRCNAKAAKGETAEVVDVRTGWTCLRLQDSGATGWVRNGQIR